MGDDDKTPVEKPQHDVVECPHCRTPRKVMPSGLIELHPFTSRWRTIWCRGSGENALKLPRIKPP